jgi:ActR/RegA family two-component response regulator
MEERVRRVQEEVNRLTRREERKVRDLTMPVDLWRISGFADGGILVVHQNANVRRRLSRALRRRGYKVQAVEGGREALTAFRKATYSLIVVHWGLYQRSGDLVKFLRRAFPQTRIIITSPRFAWPSENAEGGERGMEALNAGAYSYIPERHIRRNIATCVETALVSKEKACPVLLSGRACNFQCVV